MAYAAQTRVLISRTKTDVEELLAKHGATGLSLALPALYTDTLRFIAHQLARL